MKHISFIVLAFLTTIFSSAQELNLVHSLDNAIKETSGLIFVDDRLITHNDSGDQPTLYEININTGGVNRSVDIKDATNVDWEDICDDDDYIYIGDFGNNNGSRTNLKIYKITKLDYLTSTEVSAELINFSYADQDDFSSSPLETNFDAEAIIAFGDFLYVFSKNWIDNRTNIYKIPKVPGTYKVDKIDEFDPKGLITGASYNPLSGKIFLTGYLSISPFLIELSDFSGGKFSNGTIDKYDLKTPLTYSFQIEAITFMNETDYYLSAEKNALGKASLYSMSSNTLSQGIHKLGQEHIYPNPVIDFLTIDTDESIDRLEIYDYLGKKVYEDTSHKKTVEINNLSKGVYILRLYSQRGSTDLKFIKE